MSRGYDGLFGPPFYGDPFAPRRPAPAPMPRPAPRRVPVSSSRRKPRPVEPQAPREPVDPRSGEPPGPFTRYDRPVDPAEGRRIREAIRRPSPHREEPYAPEPAAERYPVEELRPEASSAEESQADDRVLRFPRPAPEADDRAERVARDAIERAQAKLQYDEELARAKHRFEREAAREVEQQRREIITPFLDVLDDMDRALAAAGDESPELRRGVELVRDNFLAKLRDQGVVPMEVEGERFDPERHEAMSMVPVDDPALDNRIVAVLRGGYALGDEVLRPAGVAVGRAA